MTKRHEMQYETIEVECADGIAVVTLRRPEKMNALETRMRAELFHFFRHIPDGIRVIALTGAGAAFCSGQDLGDGAPVSAADLERTLRDEYDPLLRAIGDCPLPTVAAVNGAAAGAGASLALSADVVIASEDAVFVQAFTRIGLMPDAGGTYWLPRQMGFAKAMGAALFGDPISARQAADWGMIWEAVPADIFERHWRMRVAHLAAGPTIAYSHVKRALRASQQSTLDAQLDLEAASQGDCDRTRDFREGVMAFLEKRPPRFEGR